MTIVNKAALSILIGISQETLTQWQKSGLPMVYHAGRGGSNQYETADVIAWMIQRKLQKVEDESPKDRLSRLQGDRVEIEIEEKLSNLVPASEVKPAWDAMVASVRAYLHPQADRIAQLVEATEGLDAKRNLIAEEFDDILRHLSEYELPEDANQNQAVSLGPSHGLLQATYCEHNQSGAMLSRNSTVDFWRVYTPLTKEAFADIANQEAESFVRGLELAKEEVKRLITKN